MKRVSIQKNPTFKIALTVFVLLTGCANEVEIDPRALDYVSKSNRVMISPGRAESKYAEAVAYLDSAVAVDKSCSVAYENKIRILNGVKRYEEALGAANELIALDPENPVLILPKAILLKKLKDSSADAYFEKALHLYNRALEEPESDQKDLTDQYLLGKSYCLYFLDGRKAGFDHLMLLKKRQPENRSIDFLLEEMSNMTEEQFAESL